MSLPWPFGFVRTYIVHHTLHTHEKTGSKGARAVNIILWRYIKVSVFAEQKEYLYEHLMYSSAEAEHIRFLAINKSTRHTQGKVPGKDDTWNRFLS